MDERELSLSGVLIETSLDYEMLPDDLKAKVYAVGAGDKGIEIANRALDILWESSTHDG